MVTRKGFTGTLHWLRIHILTHWVGFGFLVMAGRLLLSLQVGNIYT